MLKRKSMITLTLLLVLVLVLTACGGEKKPEASSSAASSDAENQVVASSSSASEVVASSETSETPPPASSEEVVQSSEVVQQSSEQPAPPVTGEPTGDSYILPADLAPVGQKGDALVKDILTRVQQGFADAKSMQYRSTMESKMTLTMGESVMPSEFKQVTDVSIDEAETAHTVGTTVSHSTSMNLEGKPEEKSDTRKLESYMVKDGDKYTSYNFYEEGKPWVKAEVETNANNNDPSPIGNNVAELAQYLAATGPVKMEGYNGSVIALMGNVDMEALQKAMGSTPTTTDNEGEEFAGEAAIAYVVDATTHELLMIQMDMSEMLKKALSSESSEEDTTGLGFNFKMEYEKMLTQMSHFKKNSIPKIELPAALSEAITFEEYMKQNSGTTEPSGVPAPSLP